MSIPITTTDCLIFVQIFPNRLVLGHRVSEKDSEKEREGDSEPSHTDPYAVDRYARARRGREGKARRDYPSNFFSPSSSRYANVSEGGGGSGFNGAAWSTPLKSMNYETTH